MTECSADWPGQKQPAFPLRGHTKVLDLQGSWACECSCGPPPMDEAGTDHPAFPLPQADIRGRHAGKDHTVPEENQDGEPLDPDRRGVCGPWRAELWLCFPEVQTLSPGPS